MLKSIKSESRLVRKVLPPCSTLGIGIVALVTLLMPLVASAQSSVWHQFKVAITSDGSLALLASVGTALAIIFGGWLVARIVASVLYVVLKRLHLAARMAQAFGVRRESDGTSTVFERTTARVAFWLIFLMGFIAALDYSGFATAAQPLEALVGTVMTALPLMGKAVLIMLVAYVIGRGLSRIVQAVLSRTRLDAKMAELRPSEQDTSTTFSKTAAVVVFWLVMLVGLTGAVDALSITSISEPLAGLVASAMRVLPLLVTAGLIMLVGYVIARLLATVVERLLGATGFDNVPQRLKIERAFAKRTPSAVVGLVLFFFVMLNAAVAALGQLQLTNLSTPLTAMIQQFWAILPSLVVATVIVAMGIVVGRVARNVAQGFLEAIGFDAFLARLGISLEHKDGAAKEQPDSISSTVRQPSAILGVVLQVAVILLATVQALTTLGLTSWAGLLNGLLSFGAINVLVAAVIVVAGLAIGNYVRTLIQDHGTSDEADSRRWLGHAARIAILIFAATMALQQLNVAPVFVLLAFGLPFGALCLAAALSFGLGGRNIADEILQKQFRKTGGGSTGGLRPAHATGGGTGARFGAAQAPYQASSPQAQASSPPSSPTTQPPAAPGGAGPQG